MSEEHTLQTLRQLRQEGKLQGDQMSHEAARKLLQTPPSSILTLASSSGTKRENGQHVGSGATDADHSHAHKRDMANVISMSLGELVCVLEDEVAEFQKALSSNTTIAKEMMHKSLLQLFEDIAREKLPDVFLKTYRGSGRFAAPSPTAGMSPVAGGATSPTTMAGSAALSVLRNPSRRPYDRGLDKRDLSSDVVIPDHVKDDISSGIDLVVEHELKRVLGALGTDISKVLSHVLKIKSRMECVEEELMQKRVESQMHAEQLGELTSKCGQLQSELDEVAQHSGQKDAQMDIIREQLLRRNAILDDTRVKFRKEVMRYKQRVNELEMEMETIRGNPSQRGGGGAAFSSGSPATSSGGGAETSFGLTKRGSTVDPSQLAQANGILDEETQQELMAAAETAVRDATLRFQEDLRKKDVAHAKEIKALQQKLNMSVAERDMEISRLKDKLKAALNTQGNDEDGGGGD